MHTPPVDSPPRPPAHQHAAARAAALLALCSALLLLLVAVEWHPLIALDGDIARTTHRWAVDEPGLTHAFRILTDWVWDPWTMRAGVRGGRGVAGVAAFGVVDWRCGWRPPARWARCSSRPSRPRSTARAPSGPTRSTRPTTRPSPRGTP